MYVLAAADGTPTRETFWGISSVEQTVFWILSGIAILVFLFGLYRRFSRYTIGSETAIPRLDRLGKRIVVAAKIAITNEKQFDRDLYSGLMHTFIMWGFLTLFIATTVLAIDMEIWTRALGRESFWIGDFYLAYQFAVDAMGLLFVVGIGMALYQRYWVRKSRLWGKHTSIEDDVFIWVLFLLGVGGFVLEALRILGNGFPSFEIVSFVGWALARSFEAAGISPGAAESLHWWAWWSHAILALAFIAWIPFAKPVHMLTSFANVVTREERAGRRLPRVPVDLESSSAGSIEDLTWKELLDQDACTKCGRCSAVCPAKASGRPLDPRDVLLDLKSYREGRDGTSEEPTPIIADGGSSVIDAETMESCMACMACMDACPVEIEHLTTFTRLNRQLVDEGAVDSNVQRAFQNVMQQGNSFGEPARRRGEWTESLDFEVPDAREQAVDVLWYVGDYPSYDDRNRRLARALARIFRVADVDVGIVYDEERSDGNDIRRLGEEFLFLELAGHHVEVFESCEFDTIVCTDPHAFNTFKHEYPDIDFDEFADDPMMPFEIEGRWNESGEIDVHHWTTVVDDLLESGRLSLTGEELEYDVTYHDPCHLGRFNDVYDAPRRLIEATGCSLYEMPRNRNESYCCGGGGGGIWMEFDDTPKPSEERLREALEDTPAGDAVDKFVVACPMCTTMYEDGRKTGGFESEIEIVDVAELLVEALENRDALE